MREPIVSIITRVYNEKDDYLRQAIDSVLSQKTDFSIELLLAWDNGSESTLRICKEYALKYPDIIVLLQREKSLGGPPNFFDAVTQAKGRYIACLDADDYWTDFGQLQKEVDFLENNPEYSIVYSDSIMVDENGNVVSETEVGEERRRDFSSRELMEGKHISNRTMLLRNIIDYSKINTQFEGNEDSFACALIGQYGEGHYMYNIVPPVYRIRGGSIWTTVDDAERTRIFMGTLMALKHYFKTMKNAEMIQFYNYKYFQTNEKYMFLACQIHDKRAAWRSFCVSAKGICRKGYFCSLIISFKSLIKCLIK